MVRIVVAGLAHETNTYADATSGVTTRDRFTILRGSEIEKRYRGTRTYVGGMLEAVHEIGGTAVPAYHAIADPSGTIAGDDYVGIRDELVAAVAAALPAEAVALELHGAGVATGVDDIEGDLLGAVREAVGDDVPLVAALDLHGNVTDAMARRLDVLLGVRLYPHTDMWERGFEAVLLVPRIRAGDLHPVTYVEHVPMLLPPSPTEPGSVAARMNELCEEIERRPGVVDCTVFHGFPYTDVPGVGVHVVCTTDGDPALAESCAREVGRWVWEHREEFRSRNPSPDEAVRVALEIEQHPVVVNEASDNPGGGAPGDGTHLLRALLDAGVDNAAFGVLYDPEVVATATAAGVGAVVDVRLGGKHGDLHGEPLPLRASVKAVTDGRFVLSAMGAGSLEDLGPTVRLEAGGLDILVSSRASQTFDAEVFLLHGIDVSRRRIVALKSSHHFRAGFADVAGAIVTADGPGLTTQRVERFEHRRAAARLWPVDDDARYER